MKCFYHNDLDGRCAGHIVNSEYLITEFIEMDYTKKFPLESIKLGEVIFIVDYSIDPTIMNKLLKITTNVCWIDHHKTAIEKYLNFPTRIEGLRYVGLSGAMLTYLYLKLNILDADDIDKVDFETIPNYIRLVNDWDIFKFEFGINTSYFKTATDSLKLSPNSINWDEITNKEHKTLDMILEGEQMIKFRDSWAEQYMKKGFITYFANHKCFAINLGSINSEYFKSIVSEDIDIFIAFVFDGWQWTISLYSNNIDIDVSAIAKMYGGGGHKGAAGFTDSRIPFVKEMRDKIE